MASRKTCIISLILFNIVYSHCADKPTFSQERRLDHILNPANVNGQRLYTYFEGDDSNNTIVTSPEPGYKECKIPSIIPVNHRTELGNGKMVAFTLVSTHFTILDFKNCSAFTPIDVTDGKPYHYDGTKEVHAVVPHYDTFDVFTMNSDCNPCRYNDKGERVQLNNKLTPEINAPISYFLEPMKNISGVGDGYLYGFSYRKNDSTTLRILDSNYKVVKEIQLKGEYVASSTTHGHVTVCTQENTCPESLLYCFSPRCQLLDSNLTSIANAEVQKPTGQPLIININLENLEDGGAIFSMEFLYFDGITMDTHRDIFIQQIHADGKVEPAIRIGNYEDDFVDSTGYLSESGEYCAVLRVNNKKEDGHTLIKCVTPKIEKKD